jgi:hypothetical protein
MSVTRRTPIFRFNLAENFSLKWPPFQQKIALKERNFVETIFEG